MKIKFIFTLFLCLLFTSCSNSGLDKYVESYNNNLKYGNIENYNPVIEKIDKKEKSNTLKVGLFLPLSGSAQIVGESLLNSAELSMFKNKKNNMTLFVYDTKGTTFGAVDAMNQAIKDKIDVIIGPLLYSETKAIADLAVKNNILVFSLSSEEKLKQTDNIFVAGSIPEQEIELLTSTLIDNSMTNFIAYLPNNSYGSYINDILKNKLKSKDANLIKVDFYNKNDNEKLFDNKLLNLLNSYKVSQEYLDRYEEQKQDTTNPKNKEFIVNDEDKIRPQVLFLAEGAKVAENVGMSIYKYKEKLDVKNIQLAGMTKLEGERSVLQNPYLDGIIYIGSDIEKYNAFEREYLNTYNTTPIKISSIVYDLLNVLDKFFEKEDGVYVVNKEKLLYPLGYDGIDGRFRFLPNGLIERNMFVLQVQNKKKVLIQTNQEFLNY